MKNEETGFTLIELVTVIALIGLVLIAAETPLIMGVRSYVTGQNLLKAHELGRSALWRIERELKNLREGFLTSADDSSITFMDNFEQTITYSFSGGQILKNGFVLCDSVSSFSLAYYDKNNAVLSSLPLSAANRASVYTISVDVTITLLGEAYNFREQIFPRDLRN